MIDLNAIGYGNGLIYVGIPRERMYLNAFVDNRDEILTVLAQAGRACGYWQSEGHRVDRNRDQIVEAFLRHEKKPEWLLMLDSDMEHPRDCGIRLASWKKPIVGALYFHRGQSHDPFVFDFIGLHKDQWNRETFTWAPRRDQVYTFLEEHNVPMRDGGLVIDHPLHNPLVECDALGTGCMVIHRSVFELMPPPWFEYRVGGNSEDLVFCKEAKENFEIPVYCDLSTICGHFNWVAMGQSQFRMNYINRGINLTAYTQGIAARWWSKVFKTTLEEAFEAVRAGNAAMVGPLWKKRFGQDFPSPEEELDFYNDPEVGKAYAMELLHWNFTPTFNAMRKPLTVIRNKNVLEVGAGIGSLALQLWIQNNRVTAAEVNPILRDFIDMRHAEMTSEVMGKTGELIVTDERWTQEAPDESLDHVLSLQTFEHMAWDSLEALLCACYQKLKKGGSLIYTANWGQQDIYPMHHDHAARFEAFITHLGLERLNEMELRKVPR